MFFIFVVICATGILITLDRSFSTSNPLKEVHVFDERTKVYKIREEYRNTYYFETDGWRRYMPLHFNYDWEAIRLATKWYTNINRIEGQ